MYFKIHIFIHVLQHIKTNKNKQKYCNFSPRQETGHFEKFDRDFCGTYHKLCNFYLKKNGNRKECFCHSRFWKQEFLKKGSQLRWMIFQLKKKSYLLFINYYIFHLQKNYNIFKKSQRIEISWNKLCVSDDSKLVLAITS